MCMSPTDGTADIAAVAALIADRARAAMLDALMDGGSCSAGELAIRAGVAPSTASGHLARLLSGGLVVYAAHGRERRYRLSSPAVATALEALSLVAPAQAVRSLRGADRAAPVDHRARQAAAERRRDPGQHRLAGQELGCLERHPQRGDGDKRLDELVAELAFEAEGGLT